MCPLWQEKGDLVTRNKEKTEAAKGFFVSFFTDKCSSHTAHVAEGEGKDWENEKPPTVGEDQVQDHLRNLKVHRFMGPDEVRTQVLRELAGEVAKPLSTIFEKVWQYGEVPTDWKKGNITPIFKKCKKEDPGNYRPASLSWVWRGQGQVFTRSQEGTQTGRLTRTSQTKQGIRYHVPSCWVPVGELARGKAVVAREHTGHWMVRVSLCISLLVLYILLISIVLVTVCFVCCSVKLPFSQPKGFCLFFFPFSSPTQ